MWLRRRVHREYYALRVYPVCVPVLDISPRALPVPQTRYLERGTLFYAAETASPGEWRYKGERMAVRELDPKKKEIIEHVDGPLLVIAGPGAGKTMAIVERVVHLIAKCSVAPESILVSTFTEKAAAELVSRISDRIAEGG